MNALLLIAHGSNNPDSNDEIHALTDSLRTHIGHSPENLSENLPENLPENFALIACAFLELSTPNIATTIGNLVEQGATEITVLPYFLAKGNHIDKDIPERIADAQIRFPDIAFYVMPHVGKAANMLDLLLGHLQHHAARAYQSPSSDE